MFKKLCLLGLFALQGFTAEQEPIKAEQAQDAMKDQTTPGAGQTPNLAVKVSTSFPQSEIFGVKLVNGHTTTALISFTNDEPDPVTVRFIGGALWTPEYPGQPPRLVRNLSTTVYDGPINAGQSESYEYKLKVDMHPQDLTLALATVIMDSKQGFYTLSAYNETISVVEAPTSIFDPQILFLYIILAAAFAGTSYFIYNTWISTLFPQKGRRTGAGGKAGERAKTSSRGSKKVDPSDQIGVAGADGPAVTSGAKAYDESWIPEHHLKRPEAKRVRSGTPSGVKTKPRTT